MQLLFKVREFLVKLPWFYSDNDFSVEKKSDLWSFEVNGLTELPCGHYDLHFYMKEGVNEVQFSLDGESFETKGSTNGRFDVKNLKICNHMISCYFKDDSTAHAPPVEWVLLVESGTEVKDFPSGLQPFERYIRDTQLDQREILKDWQHSFDIIIKPDIELETIKEMVKEIAHWTKSRQVTDKKDVHYGAIYSVEDKYDFQDAVAAAVLFKRMHGWTGDSDWLDRSCIAKEYAYKGQNPDPSNKDRFGGFPSMRAFETNDYCRLTYPLPMVNGVATCIIANLLVKLFEAGVEPDKHDLQVLYDIGVWILNNEYAPGMFRHHEGEARGIPGYGDCQNSNLLGAMAFSRIINFLKRRGRDVPEEWTESMHRGMERLLIGQEAIGVWPYCFAVVGRGQAYGERNIPDHGMLMYHLSVAMNEEPFKSDERLKKAALKGARWYLCSSYIEPGTNLVNLEYNPDAPDLAFSSFTWCRFMCAAALFRISGQTDEKQPWRNLSLKMLEFIRARLWNTADPEKPPVIGSLIPGLKPVTWIQTLEWDTVLMLEIIDAF